MKIAILTPCRSMHPGYALALADSFRRSNLGEFERRGVVEKLELEWPPLTLNNFADVSLARNTLLAMFRAQSKADVAMWIDSDIFWEPGDLICVLHPITLGAHVVAGLYPRKDLHQTNFTCEFRPEDIDPLRGYIGPTTINGGGGLHYGRLQRAGGGFLAMTRKAIDDVASDRRICDLYKPWETSRLTDQDDERHVWMFGSRVRPMGDVYRYEPEDYAGCDALLQAGHTIHFSFDAWPAHLEGPFTFQAVGRSDITDFAKRQAQRAISDVD